MKSETVQIMLLLISVYIAFGFYIYLRFAPKSRFMREDQAALFQRYEERLPPPSTLNSYGRRIFQWGVLLFMVTMLQFLLLFGWR